MESPNGGTGDEKHRSTCLLFVVGPEGTVGNVPSLLRPAGVDLGPEVVVGGEDRGLSSLPRFPFVFVRNQKDVIETEKQRVLLL